MRPDRHDRSVRRGLFIEAGSDELTAGGGPAESAAPPDYERDLGVIEAITQVTRSCPSGVVVSAAERALDAIKAGGSDAMKMQAYFVLTAIKGWRGERATQVHRSLTRYLAESQKGADGSAAE